MHPYRGPNFSFDFVQLAQSAGCSHRHYGHYEQHLRDAGEERRGPLRFLFSSFPYMLWTSAAYLYNFEADIALLLFCIEKYLNSYLYYNQNLTNRKPFIFYSLHLCYVPSLYHAFSLFSILYVCYVLYLKLCTCSFVLFKDIWLHACLH